MPAYGRPEKRLDGSEVYSYAADGSGNYVHSSLQISQTSDLTEAITDSLECSTAHEGTDVVLIGNERVDIELARKIELAAESTGVSMQKVMQVIQMMGDNAWNRHQPVERPAQEVCKEERMDKLRRKCNSTAFRLSKKTGVDVKEINMRFIRQFGKPQKDMTEGELQMKLEQLIQECNQR
jgi:hypothetical protein